MKNKIGTTLYEIHKLDTLSNNDQWVNSIHPLVKFILTIAYIISVVSFHKYDVIGLAGMFVYPLALFVLSELSFKDALKRLRIVIPLIIFIGILNPILDQNKILIGSITISAGVLSMITLILKGFFTVLASYLLIATTNMEKICYALRLLHVPKIIVTQFMLTYRYISVLLEEVNHTILAYELRAPKQKGVHYKVWGSLTGQLLLRSIDRANVVYESMTLRGYNGEFSYMQYKVRARAVDYLYLFIWLIIIALFRVFPILSIVGGLFA